MVASGDARGRDQRVRARRGGGGARRRSHRAGREPGAGSAGEDRHARRGARDLAHDRPPPTQQGEAGPGPVRAGALRGLGRARDGAGAARRRARGHGAGADPGEPGGRGAEERLCAGGGAGAGAGGRRPRPREARGAHDDGAADGRRSSPAPHVSRAARAARRAAGGGTMATGALDGDVQRLRRGGRGGGDDPAPGDRAVRAEGGVSEDAFHLTPLDVRKQEFRRTLRGYEPLGVEDFRMRVADELERILREKSVLEERLAALAEQLEAYRERERAMNDALVAAQQFREETRTAAQREANAVGKEAEVAGRRVRVEARAETAAVEGQDARGT